ncbi:hypothetical protein RHS01_05882 [Rhizoctonia solani]|uniref:Uncharacterized protein n=1 Tax=Rhizoctonia solani TaxID=456999 RepID=A0A8H7IG04_9AGAM|nr:hypothetical protein RHS01_05882 [Rhizoctonia solani]
MLKSTRSLRLHYGSSDVVSFKLATTIKRCRRAEGFVRNDLDYGNILLSPMPLSPSPCTSASSSPRSKSRESQASSSLGTTTSRMIGNIPGFDDFAELVISSERAIPRVTVTPTSDHPSPRISRSLRTHPPRSKLSEPKSTTPLSQPKQPPSLVEGGQ